MSGIRWCDVSLSGFAFALSVTEVKLIFCCTVLVVEEVDEEEEEEEAEGGVAFLNAF